MDSVLWLLTQRDSKFKWFLISSVSIFYTLYNTTQQYYTSIYQYHMYEFKRLAKDQNVIVIKESNFVVWKTKPNGKHFNWYTPLVVAKVAVCPVSGSKSHSQYPDKISEVLNMLWSNVSSSLGNGKQFGRVTFLTYLKSTQNLHSPDVF